MSIHTHTAGLDSMLGQYQRSRILRDTARRTCVVLQPNGCTRAWPKGDRLVSHPAPPSSYPAFSSLLPYLSLLRTHSPTPTTTRMSNIVLLCI